MWARKGRPVSTSTRPFPSSSTSATSWVSLERRSILAFLLKSCLLKPYLHRMRVCRQSLQVGERDARLPEQLEVTPVEAGDARPLQEVVHAEGRAEARGAGGRQGVVRTGDVVAERDRSVGADEDRAGVHDLGGKGRGIGGDQFQVLGSEVVGDLHGEVEVGH